VVDSFEYAAALVKDAGCSCIAAVRIYYNDVRPYFLELRPVYKNLYHAASTRN